MNGPHDNITGHDAGSAQPALAWDDLADALALDEVESPELARAQLVAQASEDSARRAELDLYDELARLGDTLLGDPEDARPLSDPAPALSADDERLVERVVAARAAQERRARSWGPLLGGLAAAGLALFAWTSWQAQLPQEGAVRVQDQPLAQAPDPGREPEPEPERVAGASAPQQVAEAPWVEVEGARTCFDRPDAKVCAEGGARLRWTGSRAVELTAGSLQVEGRPGGLRVDLPGGAVGEVNGSARVEVTPTQVVVIVLVGEARIETARGQRTLAAGSRASWPRAGGEPQVTEPDRRVEPAAGGATDRAVAVPSAGELLARAQERRGAGDRAGAIRAYRRLLALHRGSSEAHAALPALAKLELGAGRARAALGHFERYLKAGGPTAMEARRGRIEALRALGRAAQERAAIEAFLTRYPDSIHAGAMRARLGELAGAR